MGRSTQAAAWGGDVQWKAAGKGVAHLGLSVHALHYGMEVCVAGTLWGVRRRVVFGPTQNVDPKRAVGRNLDARERVGE